MPKRITVNLAYCHGEFYAKFIKARAIWKEWNDDNSRNQMNKYMCLVDLMTRLKTSVTPRKLKGDK